MMKDAIKFVPLYFLLAWTLSIVSNQIVIQVSDNYAETSILLAESLDAKQVEGIFTSADNEEVYKKIVTDDTYTIYTTDEQFYRIFNMLSTNGKKLFGKYYYVYNEPPNTMSGKFYIKNANMDYINLISSIITTDFEVSSEENSNTVYYFTLLAKVTFYYVLVFMICLIYFLGQFEANKRKLLLLEMNGNPNYINKQFTKYVITLDLVAMLLFGIVFQVNTVLELCFLILSLVINHMLLIMIRKLIYVKYIYTVRKNFSEQIVTKSSKVIYPAIILISLLVIAVSYSLILSVNLSHNYLNNELIRVQKPIEYRGIYKANGALRSEVDVNTINNLSDSNGFYFESDEISNSIVINCNYAQEFLGVSSCKLGTYSYSEFSTTNITQLEVIPFDLSKRTMIDPTVTIIDDSDIYTDDMYWLQKPNITHLNINTTDYFFRQSQLELKQAILVNLAKLLSFGLVLITIIDRFIWQYIQVLGRKHQLFLLNGQKIHFSQFLIVGSGLILLFVPIVNNLFISINLLIFLPLCMLFYYCLIVITKYIINKKCINILHER